MNVSGHANQATEKLLDEIRSDGKLHPLSVLPWGVMYIRIIINGFFTHKEQVDKMVDIIARKVSIL